VLVQGVDTDGSVARTIEFVIGRGPKSAEEYNKRGCTESPTTN
jgi:hypothetical protein